MHDLPTGAFGRVQRGLLTSNEIKIEVALKSLKCQIVPNMILYYTFTVPFHFLVQPSPEELTEFVSESAIMLGFNHPNVLKLLGVCFDTDDNLPLIILPFMENGDLRSFLASKRKFVHSSRLPEVSFYMLFKTKVYLFELIYN